VHAIDGGKEKFVIGGAGRAEEDLSDQAQFAAPVCEKIPQSQA